jgi:hypothetical protein
VQKAKIKMLSQQTVSCYLFSMNGRYLEMDCEKRWKGGGGFLNLHLSTASAKLIAANLSSRRARHNRYLMTGRILNSIGRFETVRSWLLIGRARSIDVLTAAAVQMIVINAAITEVPFEFDAGSISLGFVRSDDAERAHAPPAVDSLSPRAPPV